MAKQYKEVSLAVYSTTEWEKMSSEEKEQAHADFQLVYSTMPDGFEQALDVDTYPLSDMGNAELFVAAAGYDLHYDAARKVGYVYGVDPRNGCTVWVPDPDDLLLKQAIDDYARKLSEMDQALDERMCHTDEAKNKVKTLRKTLFTRYGSFSGAAAKRIIERIHTQTADPSIIMDDVARTGFLLNCPNGTLDLRTGQLQAPSKMDYITQGCPTEYHPGAMTEAVSAWLDSICVTPEIKRLFIQVLGVALDATIRTKTMPIFFGSKTNNGKTTMVEIIMYVIGRTKYGGYGQTISAGAFDKGTRTGGRCTPELATVTGARLVIMSEPNETQSVDWAYVKEITGGGSIHVNPKNKPAYTIPAVFTLGLDTNYLLKVDDPTLFRRGTMQIIPFLREFSEALGNLDGTLLARMAEKANREAILAAMIEGYKDYIDSGKRFVEPPESKEILARYETNNDRIGEFLEENFVKVEGKNAPHTYVTVKTVYAAYIKWLTDNGYKNQESSSSFRNKLEARATVEKRNNAYCIIGYREKQAGTATTIEGMDPLEWYMAHCMVQDPAASVLLADMIPAYSRAVSALDVAPLDEMGVFAALAKSGHVVSTIGGTMTLMGWRMLTRKEQEEGEAREQRDKQEAHKAAIVAEIDAVGNMQLEIALRMIMDAYTAGDTHTRAALDLLINGPKGGRLPY